MTCALTDRDQFVPVATWIIRRRPIASLRRSSCPMSARRRASFCARQRACTPATSSLSISRNHCMSDSTQQVLSVLYIVVDGMATDIELTPTPTHTPTHPHLCPRDFSSNFEFPCQCGWLKVHAHLFVVSHNNHDPVLFMFFFHFHSVNTKRYV